MDDLECPTCFRRFPVLPHLIRGLCPCCGRMLGAESGGPTGERVSNTRPARR